MKKLTLKSKAAIRPRFFALCYGVGMSQESLIVYGTSWCPDCTAVKRALSAKGVAFTEVNIEEDEAAAEIVMKANGGRRSVPTLVHGELARSLSQFRPQKLDEFLSDAGLQ